MAKPHGSVTGNPGTIRAPPMGLSHAYQRAREKERKNDGRRKAVRVWCKAKWLPILLPGRSDRYAIKDGSVTGTSIHKPLWLINFRNADASSRKFTQTLLSSQISKKHLPHPANQSIAGFPFDQP
jgi:hypothetical protein